MCLHIIVSGCPDPITDTLCIRGLIHAGSKSRFTIMVVWDASGSTFSIGTISLPPMAHTVGLNNWAILQTGFEDDGFFGEFSVHTSSNLPLPSTWILDEEGIICPKHYGIRQLLGSLRKLPPHPSILALRRVTGSAPQKPPAITAASP